MSVCHQMSLLIENEKQENEISKRQQVGTKRGLLCVINNQWVIIGLLCTAFFFFGSNFLCFLRNLLNQITIHSQISSFTHLFYVFKK